MFQERETTKKEEVVSEVKEEASEVATEEISVEVEVAEAKGVMTSAKDAVTCHLPRKKTSKQLRLLV